MKKIIFLFLLTMFSYCIYAQESWKTLNEEGKEAIQKGEYIKEDSLLNKAFLKTEKEFGKQDSNYATSCHNLAVLYHEQGLYDKAELLYLESKSIRFQVLGKYHVDYATSCNHLALLYSEQDL